MDTAETTHTHYLLSCSAATYVISMGLEVAQHEGIRVGSPSRCLHWVMVSLDSSCHLGHNADQHWYSSRGSTGLDGAACCVGLGCKVLVFKTGLVLGAS